MDNRKTGPASSGEALFNPNGTLYAFHSSNPDGTTKGVKVCGYLECRQRIANRIRAGVQLPTELKHPIDPKGLGLESGIKVTDVYTIKKPKVSKPVSFEINGIETSYGSKTKSGNPGKGPRGIICHTANVKDSKVEYKLYYTESKNGNIHDLHNYNKKQRQYYQFALGEIAKYCTNNNGKYPPFGHPISADLYLGDPNR